MTNVLLENIEYKIEETPLGVWRRYLYPSGAYFSEFKAHRTLLGLPFIHYTKGICPETGKRVVAKGVVAIGRLATGVVAIGQASLGIVAIGQLALGFFFGLGQGSTGVVAIGQIAVGIEFGAGQLATGLTAIGQMGIGRYVLAQLGFGDHVWSTTRADPEAVQYFQSLYERVLEVWANII
jgi:hypothetical protein